MIVCTLFDGPVPGEKGAIPEVPLGHDARFRFLVGLDYHHESHRRVSLMGSRREAAFYIHVERRVAKSTWGLSSEVLRIIYRGAIEPLKFTGKVWVFGDDLNTDAMYPAFAMKMDPPEAARHVFYEVRPGWTDEVAPGDIVMAGRNFGVGSSRPLPR